MVPNQVIVTLQTDSGSFCGDYELPARMKTEKLGRQLLEVLKQQYVNRFGNWENLQFVWNGSKLNDTDTLSEQGIWDGSILTIREG